MFVEASMRRTRKMPKDALWYMNFMKGVRVSCHVTNIERNHVTNIERSHVMSIAR